MKRFLLMVIPFFSIQAADDLVIQQPHEKHDMICIGLGAAHLASMYSDPMEESSPWTWLGINTCKSYCILIASNCIATECAEKYDMDPVSKDTCFAVANIGLLGLWHVINNKCLPCTPNKKRK